MDKTEIKGKISAFMKKKAGNDITDSTDLSTCIDEDKAEFDYSIEEPASPEDKSGSDIVFSFSDKDIKISGINQSSGSITISNNNRWACASR